MSDIGLFLLLFAALAIVVGVIRLLAWLTDFFEAGGIRAALKRSADRYVVVNSSDDSSANVMSRASDNDRPAAALLLQTDARQTPRQTQWPALTREETLDICKALRQRGFLRDEARLIFRAFHQPLDNNLWTQAAPPEDDAHVTPIVGRRTSAQFETDPELAYHPPS